MKCEKIIKKIGNYRLNCKFIKIFRITEIVKKTILIKQNNFDEI